MKLYDGSDICYCVVQRHRYKPEEGYYLVKLELIGDRLYLTLYGFFIYPKLPKRVGHKKINSKFLILWIDNMRFACDSSHTFRNLKEFSFDKKNITEYLYKIITKNLSLCEVLEIYY